MSQHLDVMSACVNGCSVQRPPQHLLYAAIGERGQFHHLHPYGNLFPPRWCQWVEEKFHLTSKPPSGVFFGGGVGWGGCYSPSSLVTQWQRRSRLSQTEQWMSSAADKNKASRPQNGTFHKVKVRERQTCRHLHHWGRECAGSCFRPQLWP